MNNKKNNKRKQILARLMLAGTLALLPITAQPMPNIKIYNLTAEASTCYPVVAIGNFGVPLSSYNLGDNVYLAIYLDGQMESTWRSVYLNALDPDEYLSHPGGAVTATIHSRLPAGTHQVTVHFHTENNTMTMTRPPVLPDLSVTGTDYRQD